MFSIFSFRLAVVLFFIANVMSAPAGTGIQLPTASSTPLRTGIRPIPTGIQPPPTSLQLPYFSIYSDEFVGSGVVPNVTEMKGYSNLILSFLTISGPVDQVLLWTKLSAQERASIVAEYHAEGIFITVSAFGSTDTPTTDGIDPVAAAESMADFVAEFNLDGIDVDYEDSVALANGEAVGWLILFTETLRANLPMGFIMTHAPQAPHFGPTFPHGGYLAVDAAVGELIDLYHVQFYNQGPSEYIDCPGLLTQSSSNNPQTSLFEIAASGVPLDKLVIGKPASVADANNGFMPTDLLAQCVAEANVMGWRTGAMLFQFSVDLDIWIQEVRGLTFPIGPPVPIGPPFPV